LRRGRENFAQFEGARFFPFVRQVELPPVRLDLETWRERAAVRS
jgi:hypothetical protein